MNSLQQFIQFVVDSIKFWTIVEPWEDAIRVRFGSKVKRLKKGMHFRLPYFDRIYVQEARLRVAAMPMQTLTTKDLKTITINGAIGYRIRNVQTLYETLYHPETTLINLTLSEVAEYVFSQTLSDINPKAIEKAVIEKLTANDYGLEFDYYRVTTFAVVRTYRLIQDQSWISEGLSMNDYV